MIVLQAEQADFVFEGFQLPLSGDTYSTVSTTYNYADGNGNLYVNGNGDFYTITTSESVLNSTKYIMLDAHLPDFVFEGWIHNG